MSITDKLLVLICLNLAGLVYLVCKLIRQGINFPKSLRLAWDLIIGEPGDNTDHNIYATILWVSVLRKTWWLMLIFYGLYWLVTKELFITVGLVLLIILHVVWYLYASLTLCANYDRTLVLNLHWGIIYKEITAESGLLQKSLAELDLRKKNLLVLAIERNSQVMPFPKGLEIIQTGDRVVMFGDLSAYHAVFG